MKLLTNWIKEKILIKLICIFHNWLKLQFNLYKLYNLGGEIMDDDIVKILKDTLEIIKILNEQKKDYINSLLKVCIALIISFTVIICCFYALYFTMWGGDNVWEWLQKILFPKGKKKKNKKDKKGDDK